MLDKSKSVMLQSEQKDDLDLGRLYGALIDSRWLIIGTTTIFLVIGILYILFSTPIYRADALVQIEQKTGNSLLNDISQVIPTGAPQSAAEIELIQSRMVIGKTVNDLELDTIIKQSYFPIFGQGFARISGIEPAEIAVSRLSLPDSWLDTPLELTVIDNTKFSVSIDGKVIFSGIVGDVASANGISLLVSGISAKPGTIFTILKKSEISVINDLQERITINDKGKDTGVLTISLDGYDPFLVKNIVNSIITNYLLQNVERKSEEAGKSLNFLQEQLPKIRTSLDLAETKLNQYRQENESVDLSLEAKSVLDSMVQLESQLNQLTFREAEISKLYTKEHPAYRALLEKRETLEQEKNKLNIKVGALPKTQQEILRLTRDVQAGQEIYMQLLNKEQELNITKASTVGNVRIIDSAVTQPKPVKPQKIIILFLSLIVGSFVSIGYVFAKILFHKGIENPEQLEEVGISVYASIPLSEWQQKNDKKFQTINKNKNTRTNVLLALGNPADLAIEAIRSLRTSLHFAMLEAKNNVLMISGLSPSIGKSFVSSNLAVVIAQAEQKILLVDADMRKGYAHAQMGTDWRNGLSDLLSGQKSIDETIRHTEVKGLDFLSRGQVPPNPSELLMGSRFSDFIQWASEHYDIVLIDTPPILAVTDAAIIGQHAGTSLIVGRFEVNTVKEIEVSIRRFEQNGVSIKGAILNAMIKKASNYNGYYNYSYKSEE